MDEDGYVFIVDRLNALAARMRDELFDALSVALVDSGITRIEPLGEVCKLLNPDDLAAKRGAGPLYVLDCD
jgi:hypothetical protein